MLDVWIPLLSQLAVGGWREVADHVPGVDGDHDQEVVPQIDPSVPQPVVQSQRRPLLGLLALLHLRHY